MVSMVVLLSKKVSRPETQFLRFSILVINGVVLLSFVLFLSNVRQYFELSGVRGCQATTCEDGMSCYKQRLSSLHSLSFLKSRGFIYFVKDTKYS